MSNFLHTIIFYIFSLKNLIFFVAYFDSFFFFVFNEGDKLVVSVVLETLGVWTRIVRTIPVF